MAINWFEGGRRITRLLQVLLVLALGAGAMFGLPSPSLSLETGSPTDGWHLTNQDCDFAADETRYVPSVNVGGTLASVNLCFRSFASEDGRKLVPYAEADKNRWYLAESSSSQVGAYSEGRMNSFTFPPALTKEAKAAISKQWWDVFWTQVKLLFLYGAIGVVALEVLSWVLGWIIRGFAGIPTGQDRKS